MVTRRSAVSTVAWAWLGGMPRIATPQIRTAESDFDDVLSATLLAKQRDIEQASLARERQEFEAAQYAARPLAQRPRPSSTPVSERAIRLIVGFEVISQAYYEKKLIRPIWPGGDSGVTVGVGYDVGYVRKEWLREDWQSLIDEEAISNLVSACGVKGQAASGTLTDYEGVEVPWAVAEKQFRNRSLPLYVAETMNSLPNAEMLSAQCLGALVSLVYNRGASFKLKGPRYEEMRAIRLHMVTKAFSKVPEELRRMKRIWEGKGLDGLIARRELEAKLFEIGLKS